MPGIGADGRCQHGRVADDAITHRFYADLARWWPLISPPEEYEEEATFAAGLLRTASIPVREVLELGSGGGHNAFHLKRSFALTLVDLSEEMLAVSRALNPECERARGHAHRATRPGVRHGVHPRRHQYMTNEADLRRAIETAFVHCRPVAWRCSCPTATETFEPMTDHGGGRDGADGRGALSRLELGSGSRRRTWALVSAFLLREPTARSTWCTRRTAAACSVVTCGCDSLPTPAFAPMR